MYAYYVLTICHPKPIKNCNNFGNKEFQRVYVFADLFPRRSTHVTKSSDLDEPDRFLRAMAQPVYDSSDDGLQQVFMHRVNSKFKGIERWKQPVSVLIRHREALIELYKLMNHRCR